MLPILLSGDGPKPAVDIGIPFFLFAVALGIITRFLIEHMPEWARPAYTVVLFVFAFAVAWIQFEIFGDGVGGTTLGESIVQWQGLHPNVIVKVFLPPLLYESASAMDFHVFSRVAWQSILMASVGVLLAVTFTALSIEMIMGSYGWNVGTTLLLASILSATDPVAVVAVLQTLGAPKKLATVIEGESLLNDGTAFVLFLIFKDIAGGADPNGGAIVLQFLRLALGGPILGLVCAVIMIVFLKVVYNDPYIEISTVLVGVWVVFFVSEMPIIHVSGVLAVVTFGIVMAHSGKYALSREVEHANHNIWQEIGWLANTVIFVLSAVIIFDRVFVAPAAHEGVFSVASDLTNWGYLIALYIMLHVVRGFVILLLYPALKNMGYGLNWKEATIMTYGGLRGAVGLALAMFVELDAHIDTYTRDLINFHTAGIVVLTLMINGSTAGKLYKWLDMYPVNPYVAEMNQGAMHALGHHQDEWLEELEHAPAYKGTRTRFSIVRTLLPDFKSDNVHFDESGHVVCSMDSVSSVIETHVRKQRVRALFVAAMTLFSKSKQARESVAAASEGRHSNTRVVKKVSITTPHTKAQGDAAMDALGIELEAVAVEDEEDESKPSVGIKHQNFSSITTASRVRSDTDEDDRRSRTSDASVGADGLRVHSASGRRLHTATTLADLTMGSSVRTLRRGHEHVANTSKELAEKAKSSAFTTLFNALKATYKHQYEQRYIGGDALLILIESADAGIESARDNEARHLGLPTTTPTHKRTLTDRDDGEEASPFDVATDLVRRKLLPVLKDEMSGCSSRFDWLASLDLSRRYGSILVAVQTLSAYSFAHGHMVDVAERLRRFEDSIDREVLQARSRSHAMLTQLQFAYPAFCTVLQTIMPAQVLLNKLRNEVDELEQESGLLDEKAAADIRFFIERRIYELATFVPTASLLVALLPQRRTRLAVIGNSALKARRASRAAAGGALRGGGAKKDGATAAAGTGAGAGAGAGRASADGAHAGAIETPITEEVDVEAGASGAADAGPRGSPHGSER